MQIIRVIRAIRVQNKFLRVQMMFLRVIGRSIQDELGKMACLFVEKICECGFEDSVDAALVIIAADVDVDVRLDAKFRVFARDVRHRACRKAYRPSPWQFAAEGHSAASSCSVADDGDVLGGFGKHPKGVCGAVGAVVRKYGHALLPAQPRSGGNADGLRR